MRPASISSALLIAAALLLAAFPASADSARTGRAYRSLAVMDLETSGVPETQMQEIVDYLAMRIRETGTVRRVVGREQRERLLGSREAVEPTGQYEPDQLAAAARLRLDLIVVGTMTWNRQQYVLWLRVLDAGSGITLFDEGRTVSNRGVLLAARDYLAIRIAGAVAAPPRREADRKQREPLEVTPGFGLGQMGVSAGSSVSGGSYLYLRSSLMANDFLGVSTRYAFRLFPTIWDNHLLSVELRLKIPPGKEVFFAMELGYLLSFGGQQEASHLLGGRVIPIAGGEDEFFFELLPIALYFDLDTGQPVFILELLAMELLFRD